MLLCATKYSSSQVLSSVNSLFLQMNLDSFGGGKQTLNFIYLPIYVVLFEMPMWMWMQEIRKSLFTGLFLHNSMQTFGGQGEIFIL